MSVESADKTQKYGAESAAFFASCMDLVALNKTNSKPLLDLINNDDALQFPALVVSRRIYWVHRKLQSSKSLL